MLQLQLYEECGTLVRLSLFTSLIPVLVLEWQHPTSVQHFSPLHSHVKSFSIRELHVSGIF